MTAFKRYQTTPAPSLETVYHPPAFMVPVNRVLMPKVTASYFSPSELELDKMMTVDMDSKLGNDAQKKLAKQLETERILAWKQPAFRYKTKLGCFPKEAAGYLYVRRRDPLTNVFRTIPEMVYPIEANRLPIPRHELLEDDWRAYRAALQNMYTMARNQMMPEDRMYEYNKLCEIVGRITDVRSGRQPVQLLNNTKLSRVIPQTNVRVYSESVTSPAGYLYRHYKKGDKQNANTEAPEPNSIKKTILEGPFEHKLDAPAGVQRSPKCHWDPDVIAGGPPVKDVIVYNEPDAISAACLEKNFPEPLTNRVEDIVAGRHRESALRPKAVVPGGPQARALSIPAQLTALYETDSEIALGSMLPTESYIRTLHES